jgi:hypothetical protein
LAALSSSVHPANGYRNGSAYAAYEAALMKHTLDLADRAGVEVRDGRLVLEFDLPRQTVSLIDIRWVR